MSVMDESFSDEVVRFPGRDRAAGAICEFDDIAEALFGGYMYVTNTRCYRLKNLDSQRKRQLQIRGKSTANENKK